MTEPQVISHEATAARTSTNYASPLFAGTLVVILVALFMSFLFNRSLPINEGWYYYYAWLMHKGQMPYRDFWFISQPFDLFVAYAVGGNHLINLRIFGVVERIVLTGLLYFLLSRRFSPKASFLATLVTMVILLTYLTEGFFTFLIDSLTFLVAGFICVYEAHIHPRRRSWLLLLAGFLGSLCFFSKQSTGLIGSVALAVLVVWPEFNLRKSIPKLIYFSAGWWLLAVPILRWLVVNGAWHEYINDVFKGAASSKGSLTTVLFMTLGRNFAPKMIGVDAAALVLLYFAIRKRWIFFEPEHQVSATKKDVAITALIALVALFVPVFFHTDSEWMIVHLRQYMAVLAKLIFMGMCLLFIWVWYRRLVERKTVDLITASLLVGGFFWGYACQMSNKVEQHAIVFGLAFLVAVAFDQLRWRGRSSVAGIVTVLCLAQVAEAALYKYNDAYDWNGWRSVIKLDYTRTSKYPELKGFLMDGESQRMFDKISDDIQQDAKPGEPIFTFPHMPMFNLITGHPQPTFAPVHYWDVCPDPLAIADAERVRVAKPPVIVEMDMPEWLWVDGEQTFRQNKKSGQRQIEKVIKDFAASGEYQLQDKFQTPWVHDWILVWKRVK